MENLSPQPQNSLQSTVEDQSTLMLAGIQAVNAGLENQRVKDQNEHHFKLKAMETNERQMDKMLDHDWRKFNRVFWLSAVAIAAILAVAAGLIFINKDTDKGISLITSTIIREFRPPGVTHSAPTGRRSFLQIPPPLRVFSKWAGGENNSPHYKVVIDSLV